MISSSRALSLPLPLANMSPFLSAVRKEEGEGTLRKYTALLPTTFPRPTRSPRNALSPVRTLLLKINNKHSYPLPYPTRHYRKKKMSLQVTILKFHAVAKWTWGEHVNGDVCGICQTPFEGCPPGVKFPGDGAPVRTN